MFTLLDLVAPIGICSVAAALCIWGAIKALQKHAKLVCIATALLFLAGIPAWYCIRASAIDPDYVTADGIEVVKGEVNTCPKAAIEQWSAWLIGFWSAHYDPAEIRDALRGKLLICYDEEAMSVLGRMVRGVTHGRVSAIGRREGDPEYTESLFYHEISHQIVNRFIPYSEEEHHAFFQAVGLGH